MLEATVRDILQAARDDAADRGINASIALHRELSHLMRIGNNSVSLNTSEALSRLDVQVTDGRRQGTHTVLGQIDALGARAAVDAAAEKAEVAMAKDYDPPLQAVEEPVDESHQDDPDLADLDPAAKAEAYGRVFSAVGEAYNFSGSWSSGRTEQYLVTTANRNEAWHTGTDQVFSVVLKHPAARWELRHVQSGWRASDVDADSTVAYLESLLPVYEAEEGFRVEPGEYTVLFGAEAVAGIVGMAMWTGLGGRGWEEKQGWTATNQPGDQILGENVTLVDDPADEKTFRFGFDMAGRRRRRFPLAENGRLRGLMYDANTAAKYGRQATGHDTGSPSVVMATGDGPADPLAAVRDKGRVLYIPALHYMHVPNRSTGVFTGSSRFSAVLVEDGAISRPIFSSRVTDSFQNVLGNLRVISGLAESVNSSNTYGRRSPVAMSVPSYVVAEGVKITDCADSF